MKQALVLIALLFTFTLPAYAEQPSMREELRRRIQERRHTKHGERTVTLAGLSVAVWEPEGQGSVPLVLFSHGFKGCNTQSSFVMRAIAAQGYLVAAPNHRDASCGSGQIGRRAEIPFRDAQAWTAATYKDRAQDFNSLVGALKADARWNARIDWSKIALAGHSLGGYTVLGLAGGWPEWRMEGVKAVLALSPYAEPFAAHHSLGALRVPVMYQGGTRDFGITPGVARPGGAFDQTPGPAYFINFEGAGHFAWTDLNKRYQDDISSYAAAFLNRFVKQDKSADPAKRLTSVKDVRQKE